MKPRAPTRVSPGMKRLALGLAFALIGCSSQPKPNTTPGPDPDPTLKPPPAVHDPRTPIEKRRDAACEAVAPRITACAVEDAKRDLANGKVTKQQFDQDTASGVVKKHTEEFTKKCETQALSSRQVRVLEVCPAQEHDCDPMLACLDNLTKG
jgi:hypothetical protein